MEKIKLRPDESLTSYPLIGKAKNFKVVPKNNLYSGLKKDDKKSLLKFYD